MVKFNLQKRREGKLETRKVILIVCEGARTEPGYFEGFKLAKKIEVVGVGKNTVSVVRDAIRINESGLYDEVWCVFDRDSFPAKNVTEAFKLMKEFKIKSAFSNESFELWYLLHFCYFDSAIHRSEYIKKLSQHLGFAYTKNNANMYNILQGEPQKTAIKNAKRLERLSPLVPGQEVKSKPMTTVYALVERLNKLAAKQGKM